MHENDRGNYPSVDFGEDVNKLLDRARENNSEIANLLPTNVTFADFDYGSVTNVNYSEIHSKLNQLYKILSE
jgi:hypothetical protein